MKRYAVLRGAGRLFLWAGIAALAYAGGTTAYSEAYQRYQSRKFDQAFPSAPTGLKTTPVEEAPDRHEGDVVGKLEVSRIGLSVILLQGTEERTLLVGAGHVPGTPLPGREGNAVFAAHRDTFFRKLKDVVPGDSIRVSIASRTYEYIVSATEVVDPHNTQIMVSGAIEELTLITCFPFYFVGSAPKRFIVHALPVS